MDRRSFLLSTGGVALSQLLIGCGENNQPKLNVQLLKGSIPAQIVNQFHKSVEQGVQLKFAPVEQLRDLYKQLQVWQEKPKPGDEKKLKISLPWASSAKSADLVTLGDYWLKSAIEQKLIQPLDESKIKSWSTLPKQWQDLVRRNDQGNPDSEGKIWAAPYRWGASVIVYDREKFRKLGWTPKDWSDLWPKPEDSSRKKEELRDRISLLDNPREVIGLVLKKLGQPYNTQNLGKVANLEAELKTLNQQIKFYSSTSYLQPLVLGDTWLAVGWSSDILPVMARYSQLSIAIPQSGTALWADLWVKPTGAKNNDLSYKWIDFCWQEAIAKQITLATKTNSPIPTNLADSDLQEPLRDFLLKLPEVVGKSEFLLPLAEAAKDYESLFAKIKGGE
jgi:putative spermidine/putrescine transport system substrate-binding protein